MSKDVVTRSFDFARTGANTAETILTPNTVRTRGIKTMLTLETPDDPRLEAQPLYLAGIDLQGKARNVIYQATMANSIYAWDADTGDLLWKTKLGAPIAGSHDIDAYLINVNWGILSTPVIDRAAGVLYACAWISTDGSGHWTSGQYFLAAVDLATGALKPGKPLLPMDGATFQPGGGLPSHAFNSIERKQRAALALVNGAVLVCFGTIQESATKARGWIIAVDTAQWRIDATWCSTVRGSGGGIWMSGAGPAIQSNGSIWIVTGNGSFDGTVDFGESIVRLRYSAPSPAAPGSLKVTGSWTPWTDDGRTGGIPEGEGRTPAERAILEHLPKTANFRRLLHVARAGMKVTDALWGDQDLGASGIVLIEALGIGLVSGKDGILYTIALANPGDTAPGDLSPANSRKNYGKLATPPILYTYFDPAINPATPNPTSLNTWPGNVTHHLHGTPLYWLSGVHGHMHFCGGENGNLRGWSVQANHASAYLGCSSAYASSLAVGSPNPNGPHGGMPGWSIVLTANGNQNGVIWGMIPYGDANTSVTNGRLLAYDAANLAHFSDGSGEIVPLWDSQDWNWNFLHPKFNRPIAVDGKVIVPTYDGRVLVLGLA